ncbi:TAXI family TRAP transporter solute-binding subunit [Jannaschia sp. Os4]|uniref:TAXI family TRAP transporter solute-binding subunit n=1 Tax=Jannaschia sp. Os4 TaxID=2807617 RepID=UPI001939390B|nr:TAXI family TRAP transporter solute-binding subunit [Jannaschia sp. Os4]MBM2575650.1 TAXI family TRAP transporter solute-binding subunit [Jannaschia sp. Os4]
MLRHAMALVTALACTAQAEEFTIGTGSATLTYAPVARIIADAVGPQAGLTLVPLVTRGSLDNIEAIMDGRRASGFAQSDIGFWASEGSGIWSGRPPAEDLRTIAALYPEHIHVVTLAESAVETLEDLQNKRIALDEVGSGTHVDGRLILEAVGLRSDQYAVETFGGREAADALVEGRIDAFVVVAGYPTAAIADLAARAPIRLVPIDGDVAVELLWLHGFLERSTVPDGAYAGVPGVETVSVGAHWFTHADVPEDVIYEITRALFSDATRDRLAAGHPKGSEITPGTALDGVAVPLHRGAVRFYEESGVMD